MKEEGGFSFYFAIPGGDILIHDPNCEDTEDL